MPTMSPVTKDSIPFFHKCTKPVARFKCCAKISGLQEVLNFLPSCLPTEAAETWLLYHHHHLSNYVQMIIISVNTIQNIVYKGIEKVIVSYF